MFNILKKKTSEDQVLKSACSCGSSCGISEIRSARYIVLGACCKKSEQTFENTKIAIKELGLDEEVINIGDIEEISKYGVIQTPALVIDSKVVSYGKLLKVEDIKKIIVGLEV